MEHIRHILINYPGDWIKLVTIRWRRSDDAVTKAPLSFLEMGVART